MENISKDSLIPGPSTILKGYGGPSKVGTFQKGMKNRVIKVFIFTPHRLSSEGFVDVLDYPGKG